MDRGAEAAIPAAVPADGSKGEKYIPGEGDDAVLHEKLYSSHLLKGDHAVGI
jgi:hypothetical protein